MKFRTLMFVTVLTTIALLAIPVPLAAQAKQETNTKHHHYKFVDLGTFGGPTSGNYGLYPALNNQGANTGFADTATANPYYPNCSSDPFVSHAYLTQAGPLTDLGALPGEANSSGPGNISSNGLVSGFSLNGTLDPITGCPEESAVFWNDGKIFNLGNAFGGYESGVGFTSINSRGQVTGNATNTIPDPFSQFYLFFYGLSNGTQLRAFLWDEKNGTRDIGTLGGPDAVSALMNDRGQIAGASYTSDIPSPTTGVPTFDPFLWENDTMTDLGSLGGTSGFPGSLNNQGQVVGLSNLAGDVYYHPFIWTKPGPMQDLGTLGGPTGIANAINEAGEIVGYADLPPGAATSTDGFLWRKGTMTDLGTLAGDCYSGAFAINAKTQVVGASFPCDGSFGHAILWENGGPMVDLNALVSGVDMTLGEPWSMNDRGEIAGFGQLANGDLHSYLLIPCDDNHPAIEGCDYSLVEVVAQPPARLVARKATSIVPAALLRHNNRLHPSASTLVSRPPVLTANARLSADTVPDDLAADHLLAPFVSYTHYGNCEVNQQSGKLTGYCMGSVPPYNTCTTRSSSQCPKGATSGHTICTPCGLYCDRVDTTRTCTF
jgi:probable HAF family extracellular repeat protein